MGVFEMVAVIVVIGCLTGVINNWLKIRHQNASVQNEDLDEAFERIENLEERIRVLEKVVTDDRYELKRELDALGKE